MKTFTAPQNLPHAVHAFGTREEAMPEVEQNIRLLTERLGPIAHMRQIHTDRIAYAARAGIYEECDALYTDRSDLWLAVKTADCVPILISSPQAVAVVHAGWRGLQMGLVAKTVHLLRQEFNLDAIDIFAHIGPCIRAHNYEVEADVAQHFPAKYVSPGRKKGKFMLDLAAVAARQLRDCDVPDLNIYDLNLCTYDQPSRFFSYRRDKKAGHDVQLSLVKLQRAKFS